jgi:hypothetical protein
MEAVPSVHSQPEIDLDKRLALRVFTAMRELNNQHMQRLRDDLNLHFT